MTACILPEFILKVLEKEVTSSMMNIVKYICDEYKLSYDEVKSKLEKHIILDMKIDTETNYKISKVNVKRITSTVETQCIAKMYCKDQKDIRQCTKKKKDGCKFCKTHLKLFESSNLKYGTI
jgi:flagellar biosynthesis/type III secretory pathway ATPase